MRLASPETTPTRFFLAARACLWIGCLAGAVAEAQTPQVQTANPQQTIQAGVVSAAPDSSAGVPHVRALRLPQGARVRVDGRLDEATWAEAPVAGDFVQITPEPGAPSRERTEARVLYDREAVYVGVKSYTRDPASIVRRLSRRDVGTASDDIFVEVGSPGDSRTAFSFGVNAAGVQQDGVISDDRNESDLSWDAVWDSAVAPFADADGAGYAVEVRIPFSQLRYDPTGARAWQLQFQRNIASTGEQAFWAPILPTSDGYVSRFGVLDGLDGLRAPRRIELVPYASTRLTRAPGDVGDPYYDANALSPGVGLDARVGLTAGLTLTATVNPDFGQVEADPAVLNLSQFEVSFEERRPFFVEAQDIFAFGRAPAYTTTSDRPDFFYSRRIGGGPSSFNALYGRDTTATYLDVPDQTTIAGAAKVSGQAGAWTLGLLSAATTGETARFLSDTGVRSALPVAPFANYTVARARRGWRGGRTLAGAFASNVIRDTRADAFRAFLPSTATVGGLDLEVASGDRAYTATALVAGSVVSGETGVVTALQRAPQRYFQRPDADYLELDPDATTLAGYRAEASLAKVGGGRHWRGALTLGATSPGFETNDLGFQRRSDFLTGDLYVLYAAPQPGPTWLRQARLAAYVNKGYTYGGDRVYDRYTGLARLTFSNQWTSSVTASTRPEQLNDRLTRGGPLAQRAADWSLSGTLYTNYAKRVAGGLTLSARGEYGHDYQAVGREWTRVVSPTISVRPSDALELSLSPSYTGARNTDQFLGRIAAPGFGIDGRRYLFSDTRIESLDLGLRADWAFTPELTLQLVATPSVFAVAYQDFRELAAARTYDFVRYGETRGSVTPGLYVRDEEGKIVVDENDTPVLTPTGGVPDAYDVIPGDGGNRFTLANSDFTRLSLRGNAVLRWQWRPGSTLFFVWQQLRDEQGPFSGYDILSDVPDVFSSDVQNLFLIKATYWFGL